MPEKPKTAATTPREFKAQRPQIHPILIISHTWYCSSPGRQYIGKGKEKGSLRQLPRKVFLRRKPLNQTMPNWGLMPKRLEEALHQRLRSGRIAKRQLWKDTSSLEVGKDAAKILHKWLNLKEDRKHDPYSSQISIASGEQHQIRDAEIRHLLTAALFSAARPSRYFERSQYFQPQERRILERLKELHENHKLYAASPKKSREAREVRKKIEGAHPLIRILSAARAAAEFGHIGKAARAIRKERAYRMLRFHVPVLKGAGMYDDAEKLEEKAFEILHPAAHRRIAQSIGKLQEKIDEKMAAVKESLETYLRSRGIRGVEVKTRLKTIPSIYRKLNERAIHGGKSGRQKYPTVRDLHDLFGVRIIFDGVPDDCRDVLRELERMETLGPFDVGVVKEHKDYLGDNKKPSGYSALHTVMHIRDPNLNYLEAQIVTKDMERNNQKGHASHLLYKGIDPLPGPEHFMLLRPKKK